MFGVGGYLSVEVSRELALKDFGFREQITRSCLLVPRNVAEGYERQTNKELIQFFYIAKGSCGELHTTSHYWYKNWIHK